MPSYQVLEDVVIVRTSAATTGWTNGGIPAAVTAALTNARPLFVQEGLYNNLNGILIDSPIEIYAVPNTVTLRMEDGAPFIFHAYNSEKISLSGLIFDGANRNFSPAQFRPALVRVSRDNNTNTFVEIENCRFTNVTGDSETASSNSALYLYRSGGIVSGCQFQNCNQGVFSERADRLAIRNNSVIGGYNAIAVWGLIPSLQTDPTTFDGTVVEGNNINNISVAPDDPNKGPTGNAISFFCANGVIAANNVIRDCEYSAVRASRCDSVVITGNNCFDCRETALYYERPDAPAGSLGVFGATISNNIVEDCGNGIVMTNFDTGTGRCTCVGNVVRRPRVRTGEEPAAGGVGIGAEADTVISSNVVEDAELYGIFVGTKTIYQNLLVTNNLVANYPESDVTTPVGIAVRDNNAQGYQLVVGNMVQMKSSPGADYGLVAMGVNPVTFEYFIVMNGAVPKAVTNANFPKVTSGLNSLHT